MHELIASSYNPSLIIDLDIIKDNYNYIKKLCTNSEVAAVIKANSYGLGASIIAPFLASRAGAKNFFVATYNEALDARNFLPSNTTIYLFSGPFRENLNTLIQNRITPVINHLEQLEIIFEYAKNNHTKIDCALHLNIGMNRLAMPEYELMKFITKIDKYQPYLNINLVIGHLSNAEEQESSENIIQLDVFKKMIKYFPSAKKSLANSGGVFLGQDYHFDVIRPGAALYGICNQIKSWGIKNPVFLYAPIVQIQNLDKGLKIGYNGTHTLRRNSIVATIPVGYADGISRSLSNIGEVYINNLAVPIIGRVSMDLISIDVTDVPENQLFLGQKVEILGNNLKPDDVAAKAGTIGYEILTSIGKRYDRIYITNGAKYRE